MKIEKKIIQEYLKKHKDGEETCPYCKKDNLSQEDFEPYGNTIGVSIRCESCGATWGEVYYLRTIEGLKQGTIPA